MYRFMTKNLLPFVCLYKTLLKCCLLGIDLFSLLELRGKSCVPDEWPLATRYLCEATLPEESICPTSEDCRKWTSHPNVKASITNVFDGNCGEDTCKLCESFHQLNDKRISGGTCTDISKTACRIFRLQPSLYAKVVKSGKLTYVRVGGFVSQKSEKFLHWFCD